jgi:hypothetical protein
MTNCEIIYISLWTFPFTFLLTNKLDLKDQIENLFQDCIVAYFQLAILITPNLGRDEMLQHLFYSCI